MKRLFYVTQNIDDAEAISDEVHALGIDDHHFFVLFRDEKGIRAHHLHGAKSLDNTEILSAKRRANYFALLAILVAGTSFAFAVDLIAKNVVFMVILLCVVFGVTKFLASIACASFDEYFKTVFDEHLDSGEAVIVIDVEPKQAKKIVAQLEGHPLASFIADSSNIASPIPN